MSNITFDPKFKRGIGGRVFHSDLEIGWYYTYAKDIKSVCPRVFQKTGVNAGVSVPLCRSIEHFDGSLFIRTNSLGERWKPSDENALVDSAIHIESSSLKGRATLALDVAMRYGMIQGDHHRMWVIDQMVRHLVGNNYTEWVKYVNDGEDGPNTYSWDTGIAP